MSFLRKSKPAVDAERDTFLQKYDNISKLFVEAKKLAKQGRLKTASLQQAEGVLALTELISHYDIKKLGDKASEDLELKLDEAKANLLELLPPATKLSAGIWADVNFKDQNNEWSYEVLPSLHEIFTLTDDVLFPLPEVDNLRGPEDKAQARTETKNQSCPVNMFYTNSFVVYTFRLPAKK